ncbi:MAG TPA: hypothetical protein DCS93_20880 [Microscillaceae bacterium]|nr:hypothetical protein [Microscillaceae bacterium]
MQKRPLFIFVYGQKPYPYINAISYCIENQNTGSVFIIGIKHEDEKGNTAEPEPGKILSKIRLELNNLSKGIYEIYRQETKSMEYIDIVDKDGLDIYNRDSKILNNHSGNETIEYVNLGKKLKEIISKNRDAIIDVTSLKKNLIVEVTTIALANNFKEVYSGEIINKQATHDEKDLYHTLKKNSQFKYRNIMDSKHIEDSLNKIFRKDFIIKIGLAFLFAIMIGVVSVYVEDKKFIWIMAMLNGLGIAGTLVSLWLEYPRK